MANHDDTLQTFRKELTEQGILHDGDTIGTDDQTLLSVFTPNSHHRCPLTQVLFLVRRFLRARKFDLPQAKKMFEECQNWRSTVEGVGIDELYRRIDPFDVSPLLPQASLSIPLPLSHICRQYPEREAVFDCWPLWCAE